MEIERLIHPLKWGKSSEGFTLVEVLISLAILSIVTVALLLLFNQSFDGIINSGKKTKEIYDNQEALEDSIAGSDIPADTNSLTMTFGEKEITLHGEFETNGNLTLFRPNCKKEPSEEST